MDRIGLCSVCLSRIHLRLESFTYCYITSLAERIFVATDEVLMRDEKQVPTCLGAFFMACTLCNGFQW